MDKLIVHPTEMSHWQALVNEAKELRALSLTEDLESYLVFLLMRFTQQADMASSVLALEFLESHHVAGSGRVDRLRDVGDKCLLFSGLFPGNAERRRVKVSYFVNLGRSAYGTLSKVERLSVSELFATLSHDFVLLMDILQAMRELSGEQNSLAIFNALDLWQDCSDEKALEVLKRYTQATPLLDIENFKKNNH